MGFIDVGKIIIEPFNFYEIREIEIEKKLNDHSFMFVKGIIQDEEGFSPVDTMTRGTAVKCINNGKIYFSGVLQRVKVIKTSSNQYYLEVYAISNTVLLDTVKHKRSFQNNGQSYQEIVESIIAENNGKVTYNADVMNVENIILQYNETDWELAKRLASHTQDVLIAITDDAPAFHFGATDKSGGVLNPSSYSKFKDFNILRKMSDELEPLVEDDITLCSAETDDLVCDLGEKLSINGEELYVCHISVTINEKSGSLRVIYTLCPKKAISGPKLYNKAATGLVLDGEVLALQNDTLQLKLYVYDKNSDAKTYIDDAESGGNEHFFKYATGYSAEGHTGWYVMPEVGDIVQLFFPNENEKNAYAASSIRHSDTARTGDHLQKFMRNTFGKEIKFDDHKILITSDDDTTFIRITESDGIEIMTPDPIKITSVNSTIDVFAGDNISITTEANMYVTVKGNATVLVEGDSDTTVKGNSTLLVEGNSDATVKGNSTLLVEGNSDATIKGDSTLLVEGNSDTTIKGNATVLVEGDSETTINGNSDTTIKGNATVLVEGDSETTINGDSDTTIKGNATVLIEGNSDTTVNGDTTLSVDGNATATVKGNVAVSTPLSATVLAGIAATVTAGGAVAVSAGASATVNAAANASVSAGANASLSAGGNASVSAGGDASITAGGKMEIIAADDMSIYTAKNLSIKADKSISIACKSNTIDIEPDSGIDVKTDKEFKMASDDNATLESKKEFAINSTKDTKITSNAKLVEGAKSGVEIANGGNSMTLDNSGIDIKGTLVKING